MPQVNRYQFHSKVAEHDLPALIKILDQAFNVGEEYCAKAIAAAGVENLRALALDGQMVAALTCLPMGIWLGERNVTNLGIAAVGVLPELRGKGAASALMRAAMAQARAEGFAVSTLYPSTQTVYRHLGYGLAGTQYKIELQANLIDVQDYTVEIRPILESDVPNIALLQTQVARTQQGNLQRNSYIWKRISQPQMKEAQGYLVEHNGACEGYVYFQQKPAHEFPHYDLEVSDILAVSRQAARRLLTFFSDHRSMTKSIRWWGSANDILLTCLAERAYQITLKDYWMLRILDVKKALEQCGYPTYLDSELELEIVDNDLHANNGSYLLKVVDGKGMVQAGTSTNGKLQMNVQALAALYTGFQPARKLRAVGQLEGNDVSMLLAEAIFAGPVPWMSESF